MSTKSSRENHTVRNSESPLSHTLQEWAKPQDHTLAAQPPRETKEVDENLVNWNGPDDPNNPIKFCQIFRAGVAVRLASDVWAYIAGQSRRKWSVTLITSAFTFLSPVSPPMIAPAAGQMSRDLDIHGHLPRLRNEERSSRENYLQQGTAFGWRANFLIIPC